MKAHLFLTNLDDMYQENVSCEIDIPFVPSIGMEICLSNTAYEQFRARIIENREYGEYLVYMPSSYQKAWVEEDNPREPSKDEIDDLFFGKHLHVLGVTFDMESGSILISASTFHSVEALANAYRDLVSTYTK